MSVYRIYPEKFQLFGQFITFLFQKRTYGVNPFSIRLLALRAVTKNYTKIKKRVIFSFY